MTYGRCHNVSKWVDLRRYLSRDIQGIEDYRKPDKVLKLNRALYGLKQAPRVWYKRIDTWLYT
jgi:hypothetical protein